MIPELKMWHIFLFLNKICIHLFSCVFTYVFKPSTVILTHESWLSFGYTKAIFFSLGAWRSWGCWHCFYIRGWSFSCWNQHNSPSDYDRLVVINYIYTDHNSLIKPVYAFYDIHQISCIVFADKDCEQLGQSDSAFAKYVHKIADFYFAYHHEAYGIRGFFLFISWTSSSFLYQKRNLSFGAF